MPSKFIFWFYSKGTVGFFSIWGNFVEFLWKYFSVGTLFATLISPWRRDVEAVKARGLHPLLWLQSLVVNIFTRILGAIVRTGVIFCAFFLETLVILFGVSLLAIWILLPLSLVAGLISAILFFSGIFSGRIDVVDFSGLLVLLVSGWFLVISYRAFSRSEFDYFAADLKTLASARWFNRVWNRIGFTSSDIDMRILTDRDALKEFIGSADITEEEFDEVMKWEISNHIEKENLSKFWLRKNLLAKKPIGRKWTFAYTVKLDQYAVDLSEYDPTQYRDAKLIGKENDLEELKTILSRPVQNSVMIVGDTGVGRDTIVHTLAKEIREMKAGGNFNEKRILSLDIREIISSMTGVGDVGAILDAIFSEAVNAGNVILFIKDIHQYLKSDPKSRSEDISAVLSIFLSYPDFQIIGTTTPSEFHADVEKKAGVMKYFEKIMVEEMNMEDTMKVLLYKLKHLESERVVFTYQAIRELVKLSDRYISDSPFPEKALDIMEEVLLFWENNNDSWIITPQIVDKAISKKIKVPLGDISESEGGKLMDLEKLLHERIVGQEFAVNQIAETMRRARLGMASGTKPLGSFLFLGSTGVGKTESAKALAEAYFGDENRMIRLDMSEYQTQESIDRLIGSSTTGREGYLVSKVKEMPYSILLLDEIEKAYPDILNLFLQVLDEGHLTDAFGKKINFRNLIIIATSNAGAEVIRESVQSGLDPSETQQIVIDYAIKQGIFRPEFLNRFEGIIFFHPLNQDNILQVTRLLLDKYAERLKEQENISVEFDAQLVQAVSDKAYDPLFGARAIDRFIQDKIGDTIVKKIISGNVKKGSSLTFGIAEMGE